MYQIFAAMGNGRCNLGALHSTVQTVYCLSNSSAIALRVASNFLTLTSAGVMTLSPSAAINPPQAFVVVDFQHAGIFPVIRKHSVGAGYTFHHRLHWDCQS